MKKLFFVIALSLIATFAFAQQGCPYKYGANEEDSLRCLEEVNSFRIFYNNKQYADALTPWEYVVNHCPCSWDGVHTYAQTMFDNLIKAEKDSAKKEILVDKWDERTLAEIKRQEEEDRESEFAKQIDEFLLNTEAPDAISWETDFDL